MWLYWNWHPVLRIEVKASVDSPESHQADLNRCTHPWELLKRPGRNTNEENKSAKFLSCDGFVPSVLWAPLMHFISHHLTGTCWGFKSDGCCIEAPPSKRPSSPDGSLKMVESLRRHIKCQSSFSSKPVNTTSVAPQHGMPTHSWSSHEDSGDHNLRNGLLCRLWRLS